MARSSAARKPSARADKQQQLIDAQETLTGTLAKIRFQKADTGWCILSIDGPDGVIAAKGTAGQLREGECVELLGTYEDDPKWGRQFKFSSIRAIIPDGMEGACRWLASSAFGIGPVRAKRIADALGDRTLDVIRETPDELVRLGLATQAQAQELHKELQDRAALAELSTAICTEGITMHMASRIIERYGADEALAVVRDNPYQLIDSIYGVAFLTADKIAQATGVPVASPYRVQAALRYLLEAAADDGHCYLPGSALIEKAQELLGAAANITIEDIKDAMRSLEAQSLVVREKQPTPGNYLARLYQAECTLALKVGDKAAEVPAPLDEGTDIPALIADAEAEARVEYAPEQKAAIALALTQPISIITGGPGTGKTTVIRAICGAYNEIGPSVTIPDARDIPNEAPRWMWDLYSSEPKACIMLAAPTGRASQRMTEATGLEAMTIHRLLGFNPALGGFQVGPDCPLPSPSLLIIDESSMMDAELAHQLFSAIPAGVRVVLVGDIDQLPSVGPGAVLQDIIDSQRVPVTRLRYNHRQAGGSVIARNANQLVETKSLPTLSEGDFEAWLVMTPEDAQAQVMDVVRELHGANEPVTSWQVLAPMHKGPCGTTALNELIRAEVNPAMPGKPEAGPWRLGDKVMVIRNRYDYGIFNGDLGRITDIDLTKACVSIEVGSGAPVTLSLDLAKSLLEHAYAITIHKSQGSEFPTVIVPLLKGHYIMLQRNLLYTAITRARSRLVLIAEPRAVTRAAATQESTRRHTHLARRIQGPQDTGDVTTQCKTDSPPSGPQ